jgi:hypothetical protein
MNEDKSGKSRERFVIYQHKHQRIQGKALKNQGDSPHNCYQTNQGQGGTADNIQGERDAGWMERGKSENRNGRNGERNEKEARI